MAKKGITLRNFKLPNEVFYEFEYMAEEENSNCTKQIVDAMKFAVKSYKTRNPDKVCKNGLLPMTESRRLKLKKA